MAVATPAFDEMGFKFFFALRAIIVNFYYLFTTFVSNCFRRRGRGGGDPTESLISLRAAGPPKHHEYKLCNKIPCGVSSTVSFLRFEVMTRSKPPTSIVHD